MQMTNATTWLQEDPNSVTINWSHLSMDADAAECIPPLLEWVKSTPRGHTVHVFLPLRITTNVRTLQSTLQSLGCRVTRLVIAKNLDIST